MTRSAAWPRQVEPSRPDDLHPTSPQSQATASPRDRRHPGRLTTDLGSLSTMEVHPRAVAGRPVPDARGSIMLPVRGSFVVPARSSPRIAILAGRRLATLSSVRIATLRGRPLIGVPFRANVAEEAHPGIVAGDDPGRRIESRREMQWIENGTELRRRQFALRHKNRANHQMFGPGEGRSGVSDNGVLFRSYYVLIPRPDFAPTGFTDPVPRVPPLRFESVSGRTQTAPREAHRAPPDRGLEPAKTAPISVSQRERAFAPRCVTFPPQTWRCLRAPPFCFRPAWFVITIQAGGRRHDPPHSDPRSRRDQCP